MVRCNLTMAFVGMMLTVELAAAVERKLIFAGATGKILRRSVLKGVFRFQDGVGADARDADRKVSLPEDDAKPTTLDLETRRMEWRRVDPSGEEVGVVLPTDILKRLIFEPKALIPEATRVDPKATVGGEKLEPRQPTQDRFLVPPTQARVRDRNASAEAILGPDTRVEIAPASWRPVQQTGLLTFSGGFCSGALVGPRHVLTAGHCVHEGNGGDWYSGFRFYPGRSSIGGAAPYGSYSWRRAWTVRGWSDDGDSDFDYALIELTSAPPVGWLSFGWSSGMSTSWYMYIKGYSGDKPYGSLWGTGDAISNVWSHRFYTDDSDTVGGNSGGPVYHYVNGNAVIYGPHSGWNQYWYWFGAKKNRHTRITASKFATICDWIDDSNVC